MNAIKKHTRRLCPLFFILSASIALMSFGSPAPTWEAASDLFAKGRWAEAEKALDAYAVQTPTPSHRAEAFVLEARCREKRQDVAGARKIYEKVVHDESLRRASPAAVADAYDRLHSLLVADAKAAPARRRLVDDAKRRIPGTPSLSRILEREGDSLLASGDMRGARAAYAGAGEGLSKAGKDVAALIAVGGESNPLADTDVARMMSAARQKPSVSKALVAHLATRRDGWKAEDAAAQLLMEGGKPAEAAKAWGELLRRHRGPSDRIGLSRCEALAKADPKRGLVAFTEWLGRNRDSKLREYAEARQALLTASHGDLSEAASLLEAFLARHPNSRDAESVRKSLATVRQSISREKDLAAEKAVRDEARRNDPALARLERAESLLDRRRANEAAKEFETFRNIPMHPLWARAWYGLGRARLEAGDAKGALAAWDEAWRRAAGSTNIAYAAKSRRAAGDALLEEGDPARALKAYEEVAARHPKVADASFDLNRGLALMALGRHADASAVFAARRDMCGGDKAEFLRWDGLVALCAAGGPPPIKTPPDRRALSDLVLADGLLEAGDPRRALRFYRRAAGRLQDHDGADRCALGEAKCLSAMGRVDQALKSYALFRDKFARSPLAPQALLFAGVLCASPHAKKSRAARGWFDLAVRNHPGTREAVAAEFYSATLAWHERKWAEAARLHQAFADNHPDSPLARVALEQRLPAIAAKKAIPHDCNNVDRTVEVKVGPRDRKRKAIPIEKETAYNAHLDIVPLNGWRIRKSEIIIWWDSRGVGRLWYGPNPATPDLHRYHLCDAYSSQEFVMIEGELCKPAEGPGKTAKKPNPPFRVTVPSVDVDWAGFARPHDEDDEEKRFIIVPLNRNGNDDKRWIELNSPYDDDERELRPSFPYGRPVNPDITLNWEAANCLGLLRDGTTGILNGWTINAKQVFDWNWPIRFLVDPRQTVGSFRIFVEGQEDDVREKALDTIWGRVINVDIDVDSDYDGDIDDNDEPLEETQGGFTGVDGADLTPIKLSFGPLLAQLPGKLTLSATKGGDKIRIWQDAQRTTAVPLPKVWLNPNQMPPTLYVEGVTPSANVRDVELTLEYDDNPNGSEDNLFKCRDKIALTIILVDINGEYKRNGIPVNHAKESDPVLFLESNGFVIFANNDDDDGDHVPDCNNSKVDGQNDLSDIHAIQIKKIGLEYADVPDNMTLELSMELPSSQQGSLGANNFARIFFGRSLNAQGIIGPKPLPNKIVFKKNPTQAEFDLGMLCGNGAVDLGIEGIEHGKEIIIKLSANLGTNEIASDIVRVLISPFIVLSNTDVATKVFVANSSRWGSFNELVATALAGVVSVLDYDDDFTQDFAEIGATQVLAGRAYPSSTTIAGFMGIRYSNQLASDTGYFNIEVGNAGGNIEASPPFAGFPYGRLIVGDSLSQPVKSFLSTQLAQTDNGQMIELPVRWLRVKHVDEVMTIIPSQSGFRVLVADLNSAISLIRAELQSPSPELREILTETLNQYDNPRHQGKISEINQHLAVIRQRLSEGLGIPESSLLKIPVPFRVDGEGGPKETYLPNMINLLAVKTRNGNRKLVIPDPLSDNLALRMLEVLWQLGYQEEEVSMVYTIVGPHYDGGEVHCATNVRRELH